MLELGGIYEEGRSGVLKCGVGVFIVRHTKTGGINSRSHPFGGSSAGFSPSLQDEHSPLPMKIEDVKSLISLNSGVTLDGKRLPKKTLVGRCLSCKYSEFFGVASVEFYVSRT